MVYFLTDASVDYVEEAMDHVNDFYNMDDREYFRESSVASSMDFERGRPGTSAGGFQLQCGFLPEFPSRSFD